MSAIATDLTESGKRRLLRWQRGATTGSATRDTVVFDLRTWEEKVLMAWKRRVVRVERSGLACGRGRHEETVLAWRVSAAAKAHAINEQGLRDLPVTQVQRDARGHCRARQHARETDEAGES